LNSCPSKKSAEHARDQPERLVQELHVSAFPYLEPAPAAERSQEQSSARIAKANG
jgi:hypothetical protein